MRKVTKAMTEARTMKQCIEAMFDHAGQMTKCCVDDSGCTYLNKIDGNRCLIGGMLPDGIWGDSAPPKGSVRTLIKDYHNEYPAILSQLVPTDLDRPTEGWVDFLQACQSTHDKMHWGDCEGSFGPKLTKMLFDVAAQFGLSGLLPEETPV